MKDYEGIIWQDIRISEYDRDALMVLRRLVLRAINEEPPDSEVWKDSTGRVDPEAALINIDRLVEDWDVATAYEAEMESEGASGEE